MNKHALAQIKRNFENIFKILRKSGLSDSSLRHRYAEYFVAYILASRGHKVHLLNKREDAGCDLCLADRNIRIEVKSGKCDKDNWAFASFGEGNQIKSKKFDYCVFVIFNEKKEGKINDIFIFTINELKEVTKARKGIASHIETNPCLLLYAPSINEYNKYIKAYKSQVLDIEQDLNSRPNKYRQKWGKIKSLRDR